LANFSLGDKAVGILERDLKTLNAFSTFRGLVVTLELHKCAALENAGQRFIRKSVVPRTFSASSKHFRWAVVSILMSNEGA